MPGLSEEQKPESAASGDCHPAGLLFAPTSLSNESGSGRRYQSVTRVYQRLREALYHLAELEGSKFKGEIELDEAHFGGKWKGKRGRAAAGKGVVFGLLEGEHRVYTKVVES